MILYHIFSIEWSDKMKWLTIFLVNIISLFGYQVFAECVSDYQMIGAEYEVISGNANIDGTAKSETEKQTINLWRMGQQVAYEYKQQAIIDIWSVNSNSRLKLDKLFDQYQRGIEYQPSVIGKARSQALWRSKYSLVDISLPQYSNSEFLPNSEADLDLIRHAEQGFEFDKHCLATRYFDLTTKERKMDVFWLEHFKLAKKVSLEANGRLLEWKLNKLIFDKATISSQFSQRADYKMTDYDDIGDNESDPFLLKMVNLGFKPRLPPVPYQSHGNSEIQMDHQH